MAAPSKVTSVPSILAEDDDATASPEPHEMIGQMTTEAPLEYPQDSDKNYPSNKDGVYGIVIQITSGNNAQFIRPRGKEVMKYLDRKEMMVKFVNLFCTSGLLLQ